MPKRVLGGRYELDRRLGRGGMAEVWRGIDLVLARRVAVKTVNLADPKDRTDPTLGEQVHREAIATAALEHPDIVTIYDAGVDGDTAYIVMEHLKGRDLAALLGAGPVTLEEALRIAGRVAGALAKAHASGIVHRDIKPANILIDGERVLVVDFGIAAFEYQPVSALAAPGTTRGTAEYMAPEQARAEPVTRATDMYSFGCLLTALVAGRPPFTGERPESVLHQHVFAEVPRLGRLCPGVPDELDRLVEQLLAKDPGVRPSADEVAEVLADLLDRLRAAPEGAAPGPATGSSAVDRDAPTIAPAALDAPTIAPPAVDMSLVAAPALDTPTMAADAVVAPPRARTAS